MNVANLAEMVIQHKNDKNYQFRDLVLTGKLANGEYDPTTFDGMAVAAFKRLSPERRMKVMKVCTKFGLIDEMTVVRARFMAQTNLFFLCHMLGYKEMSDKEYVWTDDSVHNTHEEICNEFFVRKNPTFKSFKEFASAYIEKKQRLLLVPRGGFKSTMNMADSVQWIINFPEVTILVLSGVLKLAEKFIGEIKGHFTLEEGTSEYLDLIIPKKCFRPKEMSDLDDGNSVFQMLFAEHCISVQDGPAAEFQTPATAAKGKEPTVFGASIEQNLAGFHMGVLKLDDVVTNENSLTAERIKGVNKQVSINQAMLMPYGFYDKIGTWYDAQDTYGVDISNSKKMEDKGIPFPMKIYIRAAWWPNKEARKLGKIPEEMTKADYGLWFDHPDHLCYEKLLEYSADEYFAIKYLNDPTVMHAVKFPKELLIRKTCTAHEVPGTGMIVTAIDTAYSQKSWADYTVIITALIFNGRFYIIDMNRGRFNEYELPAMIAATANKWKPKHICIEDTGKGEAYIKREAFREMDKLKVRVPIRMVSLGQGNSKKSKAAKAGPVLRFLGDDRMKFVNTCPNLEELYDEMSKFGTASSTHDDIVDALAILVNEFAAYADIQAKLHAAETDYSPDPKMGSFYNQVYGLGKFDKYNAHNLVQEFPENAPDTLAKQAAEEAAYANNDPLGDIWG